MDPFHVKIHHERSIANVEKLRANARLPPAGISLRVELSDHFRGKRDEIGAPVLFQLRYRQPAEIEVIAQQQHRLTRDDVGKLTETEPVQAGVLLPPKGRNRGGPDLRPAAGSDREVDAEEWICKIRNGVD